MEIWHNPRCTKSRNAKQALDDAGAEYTERRYLDQPPTAAQLRDVLDKLAMLPWELARTGDPLAKELNLRDLPHEADVWIDVLVANPSLIQRPIIVTDDGRAVVARDEASVQDALRSR
jgi:arsenate reductase